MSSHYFLFTICRKRKLKSTRAGLFDCIFILFSGSVAIGFCVILKNLLFSLCTKDRSVGGFCAAESVRAGEGCRGATGTSQSINFMKA